MKLLDIAKAELSNFLLEEVFLIRDKFYDIGIEPNKKTLSGNKDVGLIGVKNEEFFDKPKWTRQKI